MGADTGEDAIDDADSGRGGRHKAPDLGHQDDKRHLAQVRALASHVRAGQQHDPRVWAKRRGVGHKLPGRQAVLDHRVPTIDNFQQVALVHHRSGVAIDTRAVGQRSQQIERSYRPRGLGEKRSMLR